MRIRKLVFALACSAAAWFTISGTAFQSYAVTAPPEEDQTEEQHFGTHGCFSVTAEEPVTIDVLKRKQKEREALKSSGPALAAAEESYALKGTAEGEEEELWNTDYSLPLLTIVIGFNEAAEGEEAVGYVNSFDWGSDLFRGEESLSGYYYDMSLGKFTFVPAEETSAFETDGNTNIYDRMNDGVVHVTVDYPHESWITFPNANMQTMYDAYSAAVMKAADYVDFAQYDTDLDGKISNSELALCFVVAGYDASNAKYMAELGMDKYLWPNAWNFKSVKRYCSSDTQLPRPDGVLINEFVAMPEQTDDFTDTLKHANLGTLFHELGHYLGLYDLYNTEDLTPSSEWAGYRVGMMSLMADGTWGRTEDGSYTVYSMDLWSRYYLGWVEAEEISDSDVPTEINGDDYSPDTPNRFFRISTSKEDEYYLVENHQLSGWDQDLAYGLKKKEGIDPEEVTGGLVFWHIDEAVIREYGSDNDINASSHRPGVMPLYPEVGTDGTVSFLCDSLRCEVLKNPFFALEDTDSEETPQKVRLVLPEYGRDEDADSRLARFSSCIRVDIYSGSAPVMEVGFDTHHTEAENPVIENLVEATGGQYGGYDEVYYCRDCHARLRSQHVDVCPTGWQKVQGSWFYYDESGNPVKNSWLKIGSFWYFFGTEGEMAVGWLKNDGSWYYLDPVSGEMLTGWQCISGKWYFLNRSGTMKTGWMKEGGKWYYLNGNGVMQTGWKKLSGKWYYFSTGGVMQTGWKKLSGKWYYFSSSGVMQTGWKKLSGKWYYFSSDGAMQTGWREISGKWYYFTGSGEMKTGWLRYSDNWYYLDQDGTMVTGTVMIGGSSYTFDEAGVWLDM